MEGRYRREQIIGEGGQGVVYRAMDVNIGRAVALKVLHRELSTQPDIAARFEREAMLARELSHPNTVRLHDFGRDATGELFIAYELLEGQPLDVALAAGPMPADRVARIGKQVLKSLMEAHGRGVVHRDIKPSNIFLCDFSGEKDFVKVLDFGIAKARSAKALTQTGFTIGTASYMAPEQVLGRDVTPATDLYALGLVLAEALTGQPVVPATSLEDIAALQLKPEPLPLAPAVLQSPLGPIIYRAIQKQADRRYSSAQEMLDSLDAIAAVSSAAPTGQAMTFPAPLAAAPVQRAQPSKGGAGSTVGWIALGTLVVVGGGAVAAFLLAGGDEETQGTEEPASRRKRKPAASASVAPVVAPAASPSAAQPEPPPRATLLKCEALPASKYSFDPAETDFDEALKLFRDTRCIGAADALEVTRACFRTQRQGNLVIEVDSPGKTACILNVRAMELTNQRFLHFANAIGEENRIHSESQIFVQDKRSPPAWAIYFRGYTGSSPLCTAEGKGADDEAAETSAQMRADWPSIPEDARDFFCNDGSGVPAPAAAPPPPVNECAGCVSGPCACSLPSGLRGLCSGREACFAHCPAGQGVGPDLQCYPRCPPGGFCGEGCSCQFNVCICPPGD